MINTTEDQITKVVTEALTAVFDEYAHPSSGDICYDEVMENLPEIAKLIASRLNVEAGLSREIFTEAVSNGEREWIEDGWLITETKKTIKRRLGAHD